MVALIDLAHGLLFGSFVAALVGLVWYMATNRWWGHLLGRGIVSELAGYALISGFLSFLVLFPHRLPAFVALIIYAIEFAAHALLALGLIQASRDAKRLRVAAKRSFRE